jgi:hypothetical protein
MIIFIETEIEFILFAHGFALCISLFIVITL